jgi:ATP-dependent Lon protease
MAGSTITKSEFENLPLLPLRGGLLLPHQRLAIPVGRKKSRLLLRDLKNGDLLLIAGQRDGRVQDPNLSDLLPIVTVAQVLGVDNDGRIGRVLVEGQVRRKVTELTQTNPFLRAQTDAAPGLNADPARSRVALDAARIFIDDLSQDSEREAKAVLASLKREDDPGRLADLLVPLLGMPFEAAAELLVILDGGLRLTRLLELTDELELKVQVKNDVENRMREDLNKMQREHLLRARLKAIQDELGEGDNEQDQLRKRLTERDLPEAVRSAVDRELSKLGNAAGPEQGVVRNYLEWIADLPWNESAPQSDATLNEVAGLLDENHRGLDDVKERILEHLAVRQRANTNDVTILCLVGPPGTGKTSLGQSVADALGRPLQRVALGGVRDEAEIRGHRRTYVGARPGRIIHALKQAKVNNPVFLLDEIDKLGRGWAGDPEAALLEVLDPEQNETFTDHYLELPFDLSEVLFICTANDLSKLSAPLRDRLEIIELSGYVTEEKIAIARDHLIPRALKRVGLEDVEMDLSEALLRDIVEGWTREAGVRQLTRALEKIARSQLLKIARAEEDLARIAVDEKGVHDALGKRRFFPEVKERTSLPGVATGLAWTPVGGDILFIETSQARGKGRIEVTGQLGDVMSGSARAALAWVKSHDIKLGFDAATLDKMDLHIHVPQGAVPKDGPSAGVALISALSSLLSGRRVRSDTAMTGEITLRGRVLPVGGIKAKVLAAHRAGIERVILPKKNERDLEDVPEKIRGELTFHFAEEVDEVLAWALEEELDGRPLIPPAVHQGISSPFQE